MGSGKRRWSVAATVAVGLAAIGGTSLATADEEIFQNGKLRSDGVLTVGQLETVRIAGLPPRLKVHLSISANDTSCQNLKDRFCVPEPAKRAAGTPRFRTSGKGRAVLTFVVPSSYFFIKFKDPLKEHRVSFVNGEPLLVDATVDTAVRRHGESRHLIGIAQGRAVAEVPAAPPAPTSP
jgi:hypothetical protein